MANFDQVMKWPISCKRISSFLFRRVIEWNWKLSTMKLPKRSEFSQESNSLLQSSISVMRLFSYQYKLHHSVIVLYCNIDIRSTSSHSSLGAYRTLLLLFDQNWSWLWNDISILVNNFIRQKFCCNFDSAFHISFILEVQSFKFEWNIRGFLLLPCHKILQSLSTRSFLVLVLSFCFYTTLHIYGTKVAKINLQTRFFLTGRPHCRWWCATDPWQVYLLYKTSC